jgi:TolB-like protein
VKLSFRFADFELDDARRELRRGGADVHIEPQVFDLLVHLIRHRDRAVGRSELVDVLWQGRAVSEATISSRIAAARRAIGDNGDDQKFIRTLHGRGFRFIGEVAPALQQSSGTTESDNAGEVRQDIPTSNPPSLPEKPSIAVLPFQNMSGDPDQEYFADGLTEDIITDLARQPWFFVIARNSSFAYKGEKIDVRQIARELGVRYVLEGSVRRVGNRVRVNVQLIDAAVGNHLWAERHDRELAGIFDLQDDITDNVIAAVGSQILVAEATRARRKPTHSIDAWDLVIQAVPHMWRMNTQEHRRAEELLQQAIVLDPHYAHAYALLGWTYITMFNLDTRRPIGEFTGKALDAGERAVALDDQNPWGHLVFGLGHARRRRPETAVAHLTRSVELNPSFALGYAGLGYALACGGQPERGLESLERAHRLSPRDPFLAIYAPIVRYMAYFALGRYEEVIAVCRATAALHPDHAGAWRLMTVSLGLLGRVDEARAALAQTLTLQPDLSSAHVANDTVYAKPADRERFLEGLRRAGLRD